MDQRQQVERARFQRFIFGQATFADMHFTLEQVKFIKAGCDYLEKIKAGLPSSIITKVSKPPSAATKASQVQQQASE